MHEKSDLFPLQSVLGVLGVFSSKRHSGNFDRKNISPHNFHQKSNIPLQVNRIITRWSGSINLDRLYLKRVKVIGGRGLQEKFDRHCLCPYGWGFLCIEVNFDRNNGS